ncbi:unnamed protein product, partial [Allacma fusca]
VESEKLQCNYDCRECIFSDFAPVPTSTKQKANYQ